MMGYGRARVLAEAAMKSRFALAAGIGVIASSVWLAFSLNTLPLFALIAVIILVLCAALDFINDRRGEGDG